MPLNVSKGQTRAILKHCATRSLFDTCHPRFKSSADRADGHANMKYQCRGSLVTRETETTRFVTFGDERMERRQLAKCVSELGHSEASLEKCEVTKHTQIRSASFCTHTRRRNTERTHTNKQIRTRTRTQTMQRSARMHVPAHDCESSHTGVGEECVHVCVCVVIRRCRCGFLCACACTCACAFACMNLCVRACANYLRIVLVCVRACTRTRVYNMCVCARARVLCADK